MDPDVLQGLSTAGRWPDSASALERLQRELATAADRVEPWEPPPGPVHTAAVFVAFPSGRPGPGEAGEPAWAAAVLLRDSERVGEALVRGVSGAPYAAGLLALRCGRLLESAVRALPQPPEVLLVDATGRDHPRGAGLALHLGAALGTPTVGVTNRALLAAFAAPPAGRGAWSPLRLGADLVGYAVRTRPGAHPVLAHAAWRTAPETARAVVLAWAGAHRTPEPLRRARTLARIARAVDEGRFPG
jgi:deoxyribonuclease V